MSTRHLLCGELKITIKRVAARKLALAGRPAGVALAALWYLGKKETTNMPAWMQTIFIQYEQEKGKHEIR